MDRILSLFAVATVCSALMAAAHAEPFFDPMRPPPEFLAQATGDAAVAEKPLVLQSILRSPQRQVAIISGQNVVPGQRIRGYQLVSLSSQQAVLRGAKGQLVLRLLSPHHPDPARQPVAAHPLQGESK